jgi:nucleoid DNA-binding protein
MHKTDLIKELANNTGLSQKDASAFLEAFQKITIKVLKKGDTLNLIGFGGFKVVKTPARKGRNPQTGKEIQIKPSKRVKFTAGKTLKDSVK